jgi:hypothetical protein
MTFLNRVQFYIKRKLIPVGHWFTKEPQPEKWVFIAGCYNSGTTLLHDILAMHPLIGSMPDEGQLFSDVFPTGKQFGLPRLWALKPELFHLTENNGDEYSISKLKKQWALFYNDPERQILLEKTILNSARIRWLQKKIPNSYFIAVVRNGYAVAEGIRRKEHHPIDKAITQWKVSNEIMLRDLEHIQHKLFIRYEDFTTHTESVLGDICRFLNIPPIDSTTMAKKFTVHKVTSPIEDRNKSSTTRLTAAEIETIDSIAGDLLKKLGYSIK